MEQLSWESVSMPGESTVRNPEKLALYSGTALTRQRTVKISSSLGDLLYSLVLIYPYMISCN